MCDMNNYEGVFVEDDLHLPTTMLLLDIEEAALIRDMLSFLPKNSSYAYMFTQLDEALYNQGIISGDRFVTHDGRVKYLGEEANPFYTIMAECSYTMFENYPQKVLDRVN